MRKNNFTLAIIFSLLCLFSLDARAQSAVTTGNQGNIETLLRAIEAQGRIQEALLRSLVDEMKQNRVSSQLNSVNLYRLQMLTDSLNSQQIRVDSISAELDLLNQQINHPNDLSRLESDLGELETEINRTSDPSHRAGLTQTYNTTKRAIELQKEQIRRENEMNQLRQQNLQVKLQSEKARLAEIEERISTMDRHFQNVTAELVKKGAR
ncbi:MAG: hypothetical protein EBZ36_07190 [Acidobacteria bacterium]|nr:hypothetical protein [Acidobacteriota bacterium]